MAKEITINHQEIKRKLDEYAHQYLNEININNLNLYIQESIALARNAFASFVSENVDYWTDRIDGIENQLAFTDLSKGYRSQMHKWESEHLPATEAINQIPAEKDEKEEKLAASTTKGLLTLIGGTGISVGLGIITNRWWAVASEVLTIAGAYMVYQNSRTKEEKEKAKKAMEKFVKVRKLFIERVNQDIELWLINAESQSDLLLTKFNCI